MDTAAAPDIESGPLAAHDDPTLDAIFRDGGTLARALPGFRFRPQQLAMAQAIATAMAQRGQLVAEAGTGTGKTFAYLVPALLYGGKVIISTGTKTLQDQLFERDLPLVRDALAAPVTVALLKGRANYVCHHHLERAAHEDRLPSRDDVRYLLTYVYPSYGYEGPVIREVLDRCPGWRILRTFDVAESASGQDRAALILKAPHCAAAPTRSPSAKD